PKSRRVYFADNALVRNVWLARVAVSVWVQAAIPRITVPDPTEHLVTMMRDLAKARGAKFLVGVQSREHDPRISPFLDAQNSPNSAFDEAAISGAFGFHWTPNGHVPVAESLQALFARNGIAGAEQPGDAKAADGLGVH